jgi:excisionase family DNA binding protein
MTGNDNNQQHFWSSTELAEAAGVSRQYVVRLLNERDIIGHKAGNTWVITDSEARRWLQSRKES